MFDSPQEPFDKSITSLLTLHSDELCDFYSYCSFFCDAIKAMAYQDQPMDYETAEGITLFTTRLKKWLEVIKERAFEVHDLAKLAELEHEAKESF